MLNSWSHKDSKPKIKEKNKKQKEENFKRISM